MQLQLAWSQTSPAFLPWPAQHEDQTALKTNTTKDKAAAAAAEHVLFSTLRQVEHCFDAPCRVQQRNVTPIAAHGISSHQTATADNKACSRECAAARWWLTHVTCCNSVLTGAGSLHHQLQAHKPIV